MVKSLYIAHLGLSLKMFMLTKKTICSIINFLRGNTVGYPPQPVPTRWESWLNAALYYAKNLPEVKTILESFVGSGILVTQANV